MDGDILVTFSASVDRHADARPAKQQATDGGQQGGKPNPTVALPVKQQIINEKPASPSQQATAEQPSEYALRDLVAQEDMALWAMWMFVAAVATFIVTSFGTLLIWRQVKLTRQAVEDTGEATDAMRTQNEIAREAMEKQLRAYVVVTHVEISAHMTKPHHVHIAAHFKNVGETPATGVVSSIFGKVLHGKQFHCDMTPGEVESGGSNLVMVKDSQPAVISHSVELYQGLTGKKVMTEDYSVFAFGSVRYKDVFDQQRETTFCFVTNARSRETVTPVIAAEIGNHCG